MLTVHGALKRVAAPVLTVLGWLAFFVGIFARDTYPLLGVALLTVARVLP
jgi:hypothetical protein